jgi:aldose 1-epimerase
MTSSLDLKNGDLRLTLVPALGGSIAAFYRIWRDGQAERITHWLRPASNASIAAGEILAMASFPLLPFCNRIRNGVANFEGRSIGFRPNHPKGDSGHPLHGIGWQRPWQVLASSETSASLGLDFTASVEWPWSFSARQDIALERGRLRLRLTLTNTDTVAMPAGVGQHPYFPHAAGTRLTSVTQGIWQTDREVMPTAFVPGPAGVVGQLAQGICLADWELDSNFTGWQRSALIEWPAGQQGPARRLTMTADSPLDKLVIYSPRGADYFCVEPVSQCTDWLNLKAKYPAELLGGSRLEPGQSLSARIELQPQWHAL